MITNNYHFSRSNTMDIEKKSNNKALIKIPLETGGFWQKEYLQDDLIETVVQDYKIENNIDLPQEYFLEWYFKNKSIKMTDKIKNLLNQEIPTICINQVIIKSPLQISNEEIVSDIIGKPFNNPFEIFLFTKEDKSLKIQTYDPIMINNFSLNNFSPSSAYCNGNNHLFISGGENKNGEIIDDFWEIDLKTQIISDPVKIPPKKNHSMIFVPNYYVFIIGGNDTKTFYFNLENREVGEWGDLNKIRNEPALQKINNYLYCFDCINNGNNDIFSLERTDLYSNEPEWILLTPKLNFPINDEQKLSQKFFGVSKDEEDNIVFLGGNMDNYNNNEIFNYKYNINLNTIELSQVPYRQYNFKEKTFLTYKRNIEYILPDFNKQHPEVVFFLKKNNRMEAIDYEPKLNSQLNPLKPPIKDFKYDFNMPSVTIPEQFTNSNLTSQNKINTNQQNIFNSTIKMDINEPPFKDFHYKNQIINNNIKDNYLNNNNKMELQTNFKEPEIEPMKEDIKLSLEINKSLIKSKDKLFFKNNDDNLNINTNLNNIEFNKLKNSNIQNEYPNTNIQNPNLYVKDNNSENDLNINENKNKNIKTSSQFDKPQTISRKNSNNSSGINSIKYNIDNQNDNNMNNNLENLQQNSQNIKLISKNNIKYTANNTIIDYKKDVFLIGTIYGTKSIENENENNDKKIFCLSGRIPGIKEKKAKTNLNNPNNNINSKVKIDFNKNTIKENNIDMNENIKELNANEPKINIKTSNLHIKNPNYNLTGNIPSYNVNKKNTDTPSSKIKYNYKKMPDYNLNGSFHGKTIDVSSTNNNLENQYNYNYNINNDKPDIEIESPKINIPSGKITSKSKIPCGSLKRKNSLNSKKEKQDYFIVSGIIKGDKSLKKGRNLSSNNTRKNSDNNICGTTSDKESNNIKINMPQINMNNKELNNNFYIDGIINGTKEKTKKEEIPSGKINLKSQKGNLQNLNISGNMSEQNSNKPKINLNKDNINIKEESKINISNYDINANIYKNKVIEPKIDLNEPNLEFHLDRPKINSNNYIENNDQIKINFPKVNPDPPKIELKSKEINIKENTYDNNDINIPKVEMPNSSSNINIKDLKMHDSGDVIFFKGIDLNNSNININRPYETLNINSNKKEDCNISGVIQGIKNMNNNPNLYSNDLNISGTMHGINLNPPKVLSPKININFHNSNTKSYNDIRNPNIQLSSSQIETKNMNINGINEINQNININKEISRNKNVIFKENININPLTAEFGPGNINIQNQKLKEINNYNIYGNIPNVKVTKLSPSKSEQGAQIPSSLINNNDININYKNSNPNIHFSKLNNNLEELVSINNNFNKSMNEINNYDYYKEVTLPRNIINSAYEMNNNTINLNNKILMNNKIINNTNISNNQNIMEISNNEIYSPQINYNYNINNIPNLNLQNDLENKNIFQSNNINSQYEINDNNINIDIPRIEIKNNNINLDMERNDIIQNQNINNDELKEMEDENHENDNVNIGEEINYYDIHPVIKRGNSKKKSKDLPLVGIKNKKFKSSKIESVGRLYTENIDINNLKPANIGINGIKIGDRIIQ